ncbi:MAG: peptidase M28 [Phenylobacterium sp. RIFCSPHIGHO2_01_FULL_69_31]|uniref:M20/M25/M40 family metallo-hydrolase n=1 Tax=Phenylobacterium sp. RIFCSPHIGHO2_01_FULL_69_31 TaxID=1801944 RepID=UPI0008D46C1C|nr:M20/M25/M40 family metallo-hydrolase [Phenylobacterium sp. RIFCSPHIGHO2_01_FULL_69_31]OHB31008.1 MAG: peptidase M28 [Phenylobacterium sp. RIFCSPHIGHO2_01_FULL_69_31]
MRIAIPLFAAAFVASTAQAQPLGGEQPLLKEVAAAVSPARQKASIEKLVSFGTRHTGSDTKSDKRGIGAARRWIASEFQAASKDCGGRLTVETPSRVMTAERLAGPTEVMNVVAILPGTSDPSRVIVISGHYDSRVTDAKNFTADAPGANDDGSGTAAVIEAARVLCKHQFPATLVFAALAGEEQGLLGGKILADFAVSKGWRVEANLNNDIIGNTEGLGGVRDNTHVRVFSEGTRSTETPEEANRRRYNGGEVDSPSRNLARFMDGVADRYLTNLDVVMVYRTDRFGRGGDQVEMLRAGFPAVRITEAVENYTRQHQDLRTENGIKYGDTIDGVDFAYLAQVTRLNVATMAALAMAPAPPTGVEIAGAVSPDTTVKWKPAADAAAYRVWWRSTTDPQWRYSRLAGTTGEAKLPGVIIDDWFFGVSAIGADGYESPVVFPGAAGTFERGGAPK